MRLYGVATLTTLAKLIVGLGLDASEYDKGLDQAEGKASGFGSKIGGFLGSAMKMGLAATAGGVIAAIGGIVKGVASNAEFERYETQFGVLLGSTEKAKERLADLAKFGASTPFELPEVVNADKILQGFGLHSEEAAKKFGFSGAQIRTIAGDVASGTGSSFEEMSLLLGKFSAGATGEAISRMAELGIASRADLAKMGLEFDKSGALLSPLPKAMNVVLQMMQTKYGGMMQAQSATFEGMMSNLQDWVSGTLRTVSQPIFEVVKDKLGALLTFLGDPATMAALDMFASTLANGVGSAMDFISTTAIPALQTAWASVWPVILSAGAFIGAVVVPNVMLLTTWLGTNLPVAINTLLGTWNSIQPALNTVISFISNNADTVLFGLKAILLAVVVPAFIAWAVAAGSAAVATVAALAPVLLVLAAVGIAAALLYAAWNSNFLGVRDALINVWTNYLLPAFTAIQSWLSVAIPVALQATSDFLNNVLVPAFNAVWGFLQNYVIPIFIAIVQVHIAVFKAALAALANVWTTVLWPAIKVVWNFLNTCVIPIIKAIVNVNIAAFMLALRLLSAVFMNVVLPALKNAWNYLNTYVIPILVDLYERVVNQGIRPALASLAFFILGTLVPQFMGIVAAIDSHLRPAFETGASAANGIRDAFGYISDAVSKAIEWINKVADALNNIHVPDWLQGHSPPPMANWFGSIGTSAQLAASFVSDFGTRTDATNARIKDFTGNLERLHAVNDAFLDQADRARSRNDGQGKLKDINQDLGNKHEYHFDLNAHYAFQNERSLRDDIRMQAMLLNGNPTG